MDRFYYERTGKSFRVFDRALGSQHTVCVCYELYFAERIVKALNASVAT